MYKYSDVTISPLPSQVRFKEYISINFFIFRNRLLHCRFSLFISTHLLQPRGIHFCTKVQSQFSQVYSTQNPHLNFSSGEFDSRKPWVFTLSLGVFLLSFALSFQLSMFTFHSPLFLDGSICLPRQVFYSLRPPCTVSILPRTQLTILKFFLKIKAQSCYSSLQFADIMLLFWIDFMASINSD